jgi:hypothetical protein
VDIDGISYRVIASGVSNGLYLVLAGVADSILSDYRIVDFAANHVTLSTVEQYNHLKLGIASVLDSLGTIWTSASISGNNTLPEFTVNANGTNNAARFWNRDDCPMAANRLISPAGMITGSNWTIWIVFKIDALEATGTCDLFSTAYLSGIGWDFEISVDQVTSKIYTQTRLVDYRGYWMTHSVHRSISVGAWHVYCVSCVEVTSNTVTIIESLDGSSPGYVYDWSNWEGLPYPYNVFRKPDMNVALYVPGSYATTASKYLKVVIADRAITQDERDAVTNSLMGAYGVE